MFDTRPLRWPTPRRMQAGDRTMGCARNYGSEHVLAAASERDEATEERALLELLGAFPRISLEVIAAAYTEADSDVNVAAELLATRKPKRSYSPGLQEGWKDSSVNRSQNGYVRPPRGQPVVGSDDLLLEKFGRGVGELICRDSRHPENNPSNFMNRNSQFGSREISSYSPHLNNQSLPCTWKHRGSSWESSMGGEESLGVVGEELLSHGKKKKKKKKRDGIELEEVEPEKAVSRLAGEEFLPSMLGEGFQLGSDVVRDVLGYFGGDTQKLASSTSGLGLNNDNGKGGLKNVPHFNDKKLGAKVDPLHMSMGRLQVNDTVQMVMAYQEYNGDVQKASNSPLKHGEGLSKSRIYQDAMIKEKMDQDHSGVRLSLDQPKASFPVIEDSSLYEVKSKNFILRDAEQVILDAGLTPAYKHSERNPVASKVDQRNDSHIVKRNFNKVSGEVLVTARPPPLRALWADVKRTTTPLEPHRPAVSADDNLSDKSSSERKNIMSQFKSYGDVDDYGRHRQTANEYWCTMKYYFTEAAAAYGRGERCRAAVLSEKGKEYKQLAQEASERASQRIFHSRNKDIENNITIDLHAQHVEEALQVLKLHLQSLSNISLVHTLTVITGHGSHSFNGRARIKPAVTLFLSRRGILWEELNDGCLIIKMKDVHNKELDIRNFESSIEYN